MDEWRCGGGSSRLFSSLLDSLESVDNLLSNFCIYHTHELLFYEVFQVVAKLIHTLIQIPNMTCDSIFFLEINLIVALRGDAKETQLDKEGSYYMSIQYIHAPKSLKELDLGCFLWNEKLWMGNAPLEPIFSECGLLECTHCTPEISDEFELKFSKQC